MGRLVRPLAFGGVVGTMAISSDCALGWFYELADIDRRQADAEERFEEMLSKWEADAAAKTSQTASSQPGE